MLAAIGLAVGAILGMAGTFTPSASLRGLAWGVDGVGLVMAGALLMIMFYRMGHDVVASGFLVFVVGEGIIVSGTAIMDLGASIPSFGAGSGLWAVSLALISIPRVFPAMVRVLGLIAAVMFASTALQIFAGVQLSPVASPLPFFAYPFFVATMFGWIWTLLKGDGPSNGRI